jgi:hypothetical protein
MYHPSCPRRICVDGLVRRNYVIELFGSVHEGQFPESEGVADD